MVAIDPHPLLDAQTFTFTFPRPLGEIGKVESIMSLLALDAPAPFTKADDELRGHVRELLRHGGYKPTGRGKPASEYLIRAVSEGKLGSINAAVDACNVCSLHSGLPISVVDLELAKEPFRIGLAPEGSSSIFNQGGQTIDLAGLLCLFDADGPCANAVKDAQRTKTTPATQRIMAVVWGSNTIPGRASAAASWFRELLLTA